MEDRCRHGMLVRYCGDCKAPLKGSTRNGHKDSWTYGELVLLKDHVEDYPEKSPHGSVAALIALMAEVAGVARSAQAVGAKIWLYRRGRQHEQELRDEELRRAVKSGEPWTDRELERLFDPEKSDHELALELGRTADSVRGARAKYGNGEDMRKIRFARGA